MLGSSRIASRRLLPSQLLFARGGVRLLAVDAEAPKQRQQKAVKKKKKSTQAASGEDAFGSKNLQLMMASLDAPRKQEGPISEEEKLRRMEIGRNHVIGRFRRHNDIDHDLSCKLHLKKHAIKMFPRGNQKLKEEALAISDEMPPSWRHMPVWTAPIEGFDRSKLVDKEEEE
jgi:hypothetical protein